MNSDGRSYGDAQVRWEQHDGDAPETQKVSIYGWDSDNTQKRRIAVNENGELVPGSAIPKDGWDYIGAAYPDSTTETYTYKDGGSEGSTVATVTVAYSDSSKEELTSVTVV